MLNLNELESRWLKYKIKSYIPHVTIVISLTVIIVAVISIDFTTQQKSFSIQDAQENVPVIKQEEIKIKEKTNIPPKIEKTALIPLKNTPSIPLSSQEKQIMQPSLGFLNNLKGNSPEFYQEETSYRAEKKKQVIQKPKSVKPVPVKKAVVPQKKIEVIKAPTVSIHRQNTYEDIQHVIKRFKKSNNPALSLFVAKKYYELNNYNQAYNYALITNEINSEIEDSWLVFTKSLVKLGKKKRAIKILKQYINNSQSQRAKLLLKNIESGKMK